MWLQSNSSRFAKIPQKITSQGTQVKLWPVLLQSNTKRLTENSHRLTTQGNQKASWIPIRFKDTRNNRLTKCYTKGIKFNWNQCDYKTFRISSLKLHALSEHLGIKPNCNECDFKAGSARSLKFHRASQHAGIKYDCDQCDYKSLFNESLKTHKMVKASWNEIYLQFLWLQSNNQIFT